MKATGAKDADKTLIKARHTIKVMSFTGSSQTSTVINTVCALDGTTSHYLQKLMSATS